MQELQKGKALYQSTCTVCHNENPKKEGAVGPAIAGASLELVMSKVKTGLYPAGYKPKRTTKLMVPLPHLSDDDIRAISRYLENP